MKQLTEEQMEKICVLVAENRKIAAAKLYRQYQNVGLAEAKAFIDNLMTNTPSNPKPMEKNDAHGQGMEEVHRLIFQSQKIQAIKKYREQSNLSLKDCKNFIDKLSEELYEKHPEKFAPKTAQGCLISCIFIMAIFCYFVIA